jgi:hypothetical protein
MSQCTLNPFLAPTHAIAIPEWFVWVAGNDPIGPVSAAQIAHGIKAGQLPSDALLARSGGDDWEEVLDARAVLDALKTI